MDNRLFFPKKSFGQNFLIDKNISQKIVDLLRIDEGDRIIEIGPGQGALTSFLFKKGSCILTIEKDKSLAYLLREKFPSLYVIIMDALKFPWEKIDSKFNKIIGNLPYNIATPLIWDIAASCCKLDKMVFTVQKEVAQKLGAKLGEKKYGMLSVWIQTFCEVKLGININPACFSPRPKVMSQVVILTPKKIFLDKKSKKILSQTLKTCFKSPQKQLGNLLKTYWNKEIEDLLRKRGLRREMRPRELTPEDFLELSKIIF